MRHVPSFAPELFIPNGVRQVDFYLQAFDATEVRRFSNDDGSIHVSELSIDGNLFHLHEVTRDPAFFTPSAHSGTTVLIGLFVQDVDLVVARAIAGGATLLSPAQDYDYGYRQARFKDPFGHCWMIQKQL